MVEAGCRKDLEAVHVRLTLFNVPVEVDFVSIYRIACLIKSANIDNLARAFSFVLTLTVNAFLARAAIRVAAALNRTAVNTAHLLATVFTEGAFLSTSF